VPPPRQCEAYEFNVHWSAAAFGFPNPFYVPPPNQEYATIQWHNVHIVGLFQACYQETARNPFFHGVPPHIILNYVDDCVAAKIIPGAGIIGGSPAAPYNGYGRCNAWMPNHIGIPMCSHGTIYFDRNGNPTNPPPWAAICAGGSISWMASPVSLLWDGQEDLDATVSVSRFPLDPSSPEGTWYLWRGSTTQPLVVHDPTGSGKVESAQQLMGKWAFGGRVDQETGKRVAWKDGFEALAVLDSDRDGRIAGKELSGISLWFDANKNGVSDPGEVKPAASVDLVSLGYAVTRREETSGNVYAALGFERKGPSGIKSGVAVDWHSPSASNPEALISTAISASKGVQFERLAVPSGDGGPSPALSEFDAAVAGMWEFTTTTVEGADHITLGSVGHLGFRVEKGRLTGHSYSALAFKASSPVAGAVHVTALEGPNPDTAKKQIVFNTSVGVAHLHSVATLDDTLRQMSGTTTVEAVVDGKPLKFSYRWNAKKLAARA
jgi:hypothetical protein